MTQLAVTNWSQANGGQLVRQGSSSKKPRPATGRCGRVNFTSSRARLLRGETLATIPHGIFAFCPVSLITPRLIVGLGSRCREDPPRCLEGGAGLVEGRSGPGGAFARPRAWIEAAAPLPLRGGVGIADAPRDGADVYVAIMNVPAVLAFGISAAGEFRHARY